MNTNQINKSWNFNNTTAKVEGSFAELTFSYEDEFTGEISHTFTNNFIKYLTVLGLCSQISKQPSEEEVVEYIKETILTQKNK